MRVLVAVFGLLLLCPSCTGAGRDLSALGFSCGSDGDCTAGYFCQAGSCALVREPRPATLPDSQVSDGGRPDAAVSTRFDAGAGDAGPADAGPRDAGNPAGSSDAGTGGQVDAGPVAFADGASCGLAGQCASGFCLDGVCCGTPCAGACQSCGLAGSKGICTSVPVGSAGRGSCDPFVCGGGPSCPTACSSSFDCMGSAPCEGGACLSKLSSISDNFDDNLIDSLKWNVFGNTGTSSAEMNGQMRLTTAAGKTGYVVCESRQLFDARGSSVKVRFADLGNQALATMEMSLSIRATSNTRVQLIVRNNWVILKREVAGVQTFPKSTPFSTARPWLRIREADGNTYFEQSGDGVTFAELVPPIPNAFPMDKVRGSVEVGTYQIETTSSTVAFDDLNLP